MVVWYDLLIRVGGDEDAETFEAADSVLDKNAQLGERPVLLFLLGAELRVRVFLAFAGLFVREGDAVARVVGLNTLVARVEQHLRNKRRELRDLLVDIISPPSLDSVVRLPPPPPFLGHDRSSVNAA